ncbi:MAG: FitA-like ribbon-helix-helix domain-containing protein [Propylenella sp.]
MRYFPAMGSILIRNVDDQTKALLRRRAAEHGHSMEEEARAILKGGLRRNDEPVSIVDLALELFGPEHGVDLEPHPEAFAREPPDFSE